MGRTVASCLCCEGHNLDAQPAIWMPFVADRALGLPPLTIDSSWDLRTIPECTAYCLCKSLHCLDCGHLFVDYRFDNREMQLLYDDYRGEAYTKLREVYEPGYAEHNGRLCAGAGYKAAVEEFLLPFLPGDSLSILDWGGDTGVNTPFGARQERLDIFDLSAKPLQHGSAVIHPDQVKGVSYDLVVLSQVLEHIPDPASTLNEILPCLSSSTVLYIEFPHEKVQRSWDEEGSLAARKRHWHEHINFFSPQSAHKLFSRCGLEMIGQCSLALNHDLTPAADGENAILMFALKNSRL
jgi:hypothetical protein